MTIFTGTAGDDSIVGTAQGDDFHLEDGGNDTVWGGAGKDVFYMGASFTGEDQIDGGGGDDYLVLDGDYSTGVMFSDGCIANIETVLLTTGHSYTLSGLAVAQTPMTIDGSGLSATDRLVVDGSGGNHSERLKGGEGGDALTGGNISDDIRGGAGADTLSGGMGRDYLYGGDGNDRILGDDGDDVIYGGLGKNGLNGGFGNDQITVEGGINVISGGAGSDSIKFLTAFGAKDRVYGGDGEDGLALLGGTTVHQLFDRAHISGIESLHVGNGTYDLVLLDAYTTESHFTAAAEKNGILHFDGSAETDATLLLTGSEGDDLLIGGALGDSLRGGAGNDTLIGGDGNDVLDGSRRFFSTPTSDSLVGGAGSDTLRGGTAIDHFVYTDARDSTVLAPDWIYFISNKDFIDLTGVDADATQAGDQAFHLVSALAGHAGELAVVYDPFHKVTNVEGDTDGDGVLDLLIVLHGDQSGFTSFML